MKPFTLFEHESLPWDWTDRDLGLVEKLNQASGVEILRLGVRHGQRCLQAASQVGVIRLAKHTIQVLPKIYKDSPTASRENQIREASSNLLHMLAGSGQLPIREQEISPLLRRDLDWFEVLTRLFASHLIREWQRGPYRNYTSREEELPVLKGKWKIASQLRQPGHMNRFDVSYDDFSGDNEFNRVFRFVSERLWSLARDPENRRLLTNLHQLLDDVNLVHHLSIDEVEKITINRLNQRFEPVFNLAKLFVDGGSLQLAGGEESAFSLTFDMNALYETYIVSFITRHRQEILPADLQECSLLPQAKSAARFLANNQNQQQVFHLKPDLAFRLERGFPLLLDAKYKILDERDFRQLGVSQGDFYQMYAYTHRYDCPRVILLYPETAGMNMPVKAHFTLQDEQYSIEARSINLKMDLGNLAGRQNLMEQLRNILEE